MKILDISLTISEEMEYYPGETRYTSTPVYELRNGDGGNSSEIVISSHCGTHIDPPSHVSDGGVSASEVDLSKLVGSCLVLDLTHLKGNICADDIHQAIEGRTSDIILVKTIDDSKKRVGELDLSKNIVFTQDAARYIQSKPIKAVGTDSLTFGDRDTHLEILNGGCVIIEGLDLSNVNGGEYFLICLPLKLKGMDGAPSRAILLDVLELRQYLGN